MKVELSTNNHSDVVILEVIKKKIPHSAGTEMVSTKGILVAIDNQGCELLDTDLNVLDLGVAERHGQGLLNEIQYNYKIIGNINS